MEISGKAIRERWFGSADEGRYTSTKKLGCEKEKNE
jgi:hypothetical protein